MTRLSIEITGKIRSGLFLLSALDEQGPIVARRATDKLALNFSEGEGPPDFLAQSKGRGSWSSG